MPSLHCQWHGLLQVMYFIRVLAYISPSPVREPPSACVTMAAPKMPTRKSKIKMHVLI